VYFLGAQNSTYSDYFTGSYGHSGRYFWLPNVLTMDVTGKASRTKALATPQARRLMLTQLMRLMPTNLRSHQCQMF
jgi:hypothetical protein